ncbi:N-6 DNA methylase [Rhizobium sp. BR 249]|uniref:N-6 DNA methylase n=1 Tax=Rhizobium sp. BR 249 TaxID=3040011 RepID=UPI0039BFAB11
MFVVENTPTICFVNSKRLGERSKVDAIRQRLWNQNLASALLVCDEARVDAFSIPKWKDDVSAADGLSAKEARVDGNWSASEVQSSEVQQRLSDWFDPNLRVDRQLLRRLEAAVQALTQGEDPALASKDQAKMLLAQILFISYLEHRGIAGDEYRRQHDLGKLHDLVVAKDGAGVDRLISQLKKDFNGDFLEPRDINWQGLDERVLQTVDAFLSRVDLRTGQKDFWNYDFSHIPVELLSGIYEVFLGEDKQDEGAYYTPRVLAELAIEQAFEGLQSLSDLRVYDGACGSGILLTTAFRRIVSWEESGRGSNLTIQERIKLLRKTIFGGDINPIACRVTAFSLYLCLLERLAPADLTQLQGDEDCKLPELVGQNIAQGDDQGDFFSDANPFSSSGNFDLIVSNPPWRELKQGKGERAKAWAEDHQVRLPHKQIAAAYAMKAMLAVKPGGRLLLILPTSLITAPSNADFIKQLAVRATVERMTNLSDFRRILFAEAEHACTIVRATNLPGLKEGRVEGSFEYWVPKVDISFAFNRLTLHDYDHTTLRRSELIEGNARLRRLFWGGRRDEGLYSRLLEFPQIADVAKMRGWVIAKGYHMKDGDKRADPTVLQAYRFLPTTALNTASPIVSVAKLGALPVHRGVSSLGNTALYEGERVLVPDGTSVEMEIRAGYANEPFCFNSAVGGIRLPDGERDLAQFLTLYLRSSLAKYFLILTAYTAQTERARVTLSDIKGLPFPRLQSKSSDVEEAISTAGGLLHELADDATRDFGESHAAELQKRIDKTVFNVFGLAENERILIQDMVRLSASSLQPTSYGEILTPLQKHPGMTEINNYGKMLEKSLLTWSRNLDGKGTISARVVDRGSDRTPLDVIHVALRIRDSEVQETPHGSTAREIINAIALEIAGGRPIDFFAMPNSIFVWGDDIFVIKPRRMRFWTESAALRDADEIFELIASGWKRGSGVYSH